MLFVIATCYLLIISHAPVEPYASKAYFNQLWNEKQHFTPHIFFFVSFFLRFNQLAVGSVDESSFAYLSKLQVLDINAGNPNLPFNREEMEGDKLLGEEET